ncbi:MAG: DNA/RNA non-specific endonuclease [Eggerthellaceae bacterium]|nr:DNA/RNA non-specific endonuclease [Eggerthellaceae bacterium]
MKPAITSLKLRNNVARIVLAVLLLTCAFATIGCAGEPEGPAGYAANAPGNSGYASHASSRVSEGSSAQHSSAVENAQRITAGTIGFDPASAEAYAGQPSCVINHNNPFFTSEELAHAQAPLEAFSPLDELGRCGGACALVTSESLPSEPRGSIESVRPSGWQVSTYDWVDGLYLFNRCHLIGYQLTGQNDNDLNLITGTRSLNVQGMQPLENMIAAFVRNTGTSVLYRVTPVFDGSNLVASGVLMEAQSIGDDGKGMKLCRWCYNAEPGVGIDYATGENWADGTISMEETADGAVVVVHGESRLANPGSDDAPGDATTGAASGNATSNEAEGSQTDNANARQFDYVLNMNSRKFHYPDCAAVIDMSEKNKRYFEGTHAEAVEMGFEPCGICEP